MEAKKEPVEATGQVATGAAVAVVSAPLMLRRPALAVAAKEAARLQQEREEKENLNISRR